MHYAINVLEDVDWSHRGDYMQARHSITVPVANAKDKRIYMEAHDHEQD